MQLKLIERLDTEDRIWTAGVAANLTVSRKGVGYEAMRSSSDRRLIDLFHEIMGVGTVGGPYGSGTYRWRWNLTGKRIEELLECWKGWLAPSVRKKLEETQLRLGAREAGKALVRVLEQEQRMVQMENYLEGELAAAEGRVG